MCGSGACDVAKALLNKYASQLVVCWGAASKHVLAR
jgi:hypothetical protein